MPTRKEEIVKYLEEVGFICKDTDNRNIIALYDKEEKPLCLINTRKCVIQFSLLNDELDWSVHCIIAEAIGCLRCYA